jgi:hypothetical protein
MDGVSGISVAQVILDQPEIVTPIRQSKAAGVSQRVRMDLRQAGALRCGRDQVIDRLPGERLAAFGDEEPRESVPTGGQIALDRTEFIPADGLFDGQPVVAVHPLAAQVADFVRGRVHDRGGGPSLHRVERRQ